MNKCKYTSFYWALSRINFHYSISLTPFVTVPTIKRLGILFSNDLSFDNRINCICNKSVKILWFINRSTVGFSNIYAFNNLYTSLLFSVLEYAAIVWSLCHVSYAKRLIKYITNFFKWTLFVVVSSSPISNPYVKDKSNLMLLLIITVFSMLPTYWLNTISRSSILLVNPVNF